MKELRGLGFWVTCPHPHISHRLGKSPNIYLFTEIKTLNLQTYSLCYVTLPPERDPQGLYFNTQGSLIFPAEYSVSSK